MTRRARTAAAAGVAALALPAAAHGFVHKPFQTPSKRIMCAYIGQTTRSAEIRCDLTFLNDVAYVVGPKGKGRRVHVTDAVGDPKAKVVAYGHSVSYGRYTCTSRTSGLTCRNRATKHGFTVSREKRRVF